MIFVILLCWLVVESAFMLTDTLQQGIEKAAEVIASGEAAKKLEALVHYSNNC